ncbi:MAG: hypothetical protein ABIH25_02120 [Candidatus Woesearchaeota archaeon]
MKIKNKKRMIGWISLVVSIVIIGIVILLNNIILLSPVGVIYDREPVLSWSGFDNDYRLLVGEDSEFNAPIVDVLLEDNKFEFEDNLEFGEYYWKVISNDKESITGYFIIDSMIKVEVDNKLRNKGNTPILIGGITGGAVLDIDDEINIEKGENYTIRQK